MMFVCPQCKGELEQPGESYRCLLCGRIYPIICGIPDFRLAPDPYIGLAADREKGRLLAEAGLQRSFADLVRFYYSITPEDPADLAKHWIARTLAEVEIARFTFETYGVSGGQFLDLGCSTGAMLIAAARSCAVLVGVDVAFRWLIMGQARLRELGVPANLICANAEYLPFRADSFDAVTAVDLLEHVPRAEAVVQEAFRVSRPGARNVFRTNNRFAPIPEPHVHLWGIGMLPRAWQPRYVSRRRKDLHPYQIQLRSVRELERICRNAGYRSVVVSSAVMHAPQIKSPIVQQAIRVYNAVGTWPVISELLKLAGPVLVSVAEK